MREQRTPQRKWLANAWRVVSKGGRGKLTNDVVFSQLRAGLGLLESRARCATAGSPVMLSTDCVSEMREQPGHKVGAYGGVSEPNNETLRAHGAVCGGPSVSTNYAPGLRKRPAHKVQWRPVAAWPGCEATGATHGAVGVTGVDQLHAWAAKAPRAHLALGA